jgi:hypothetical protein
MIKMEREAAVFCQKEVCMKKLGAFLEKMDLFQSLLVIAWSVCIVFYSLAVDARYLTFDIPMGVWICILLVCIFLGIFLQRKLAKNPDEASNQICFQAFYFGIPTVIMVLRFFLQDTFYHFSVGFMPGLSALGLFVVNLALGGVAVLGWIGYYVFRMIGKRREKAGKLGAPAWWTKTKYVMNYVVLAAFVLVLSVGTVVFAVVSAQEASQKKAVLRDEEYLQERLQDLVEKNIVASTEEAAEKLLYDGFSGSYVVEVLAKDEAKQTTVDPGLFGTYTMAELADQANTLLSVSRISEQALSEGISNYMTFVDRYPALRDVERLNQEIVGDADYQTIRVSAQFQVVDERASEIFDAYMITIFNENWEIVSVKCQRDPLRN